MSQLLPVTAVVPVKNEEQGLALCLRRLGRFAEVVVVDSSSTDRTVAVAEQFGANVVNFHWDGKFPKKRNWLLLTYEFKTDWVLFLDADELVDDRFCDALGRALSSQQHVGYWLNYTNYFQDRALRYGLPQRKLALMRVGAGLYEKIEEVDWSSLDMEVHEHPILNGSLGEIAAKIDHKDDRGIRHFTARHLEYASWEAKRWRALRASVDSNRIINALTPRQRFKYNNLHRWWYPAFYFGYTYFGRLGLLDGAAGFAYAAMKFWYFTLIQLLIRETNRRDLIGASPAITERATRKTA